MNSWYPTPFTSTTTRWGSLLARRPRSWAIISARPQSPPQAGGVMVADGDRQGVSGVGRLRRLLEAQEQPNHFLDLILLRAPVAGHRLFDLQGRILMDLE